MSKTRAERVLFLEAPGIVEGSGEIQVPDDNRPYVNWPGAVTYQGRVYRYYKGDGIPSWELVEYIRVGDAQELQNVVMSK